MVYQTENPKIISSLANRVTIVNRRATININAACIRGLLGQFINAGEPLSKRTTPASLSEL